MNVSLLQCQSSIDINANLSFIESQLNQLKIESSQPHLVVLPECCLLLGGRETAQIAAAAPEQNHPLKQSLIDLSCRYQVYMVAGTIPVLADDGRIYSRSYLFAPDGQVLGQYDKLHLFDVDVADGTGRYRESDTFCPGSHICVVDTPMAKIGLAICYDLRFPELFRALTLAGAEVIVLPAAFTQVTGAAHWQVLLQARAIENQCFILAADQWGQHNQGKRHTYGHSMVVDPWGRVQACLPEGLGWLHTQLDLAELAKVRNSMPVQTHNRFAPPTLQAL